MIGIALTAMVCAITVVAAADGQENVRSCELYNEARPIADLEPCLYRELRDGLGRQVLERAGRQLQPEEWVETTCRMMMGGGLPAG